MGHGALRRLPTRKSFGDGGWYGSPPAKIRKGGGLPRSSAKGGWYRGTAPLTISSFSLAAKLSKLVCNKMKGRNNFIVNGSVLRNIFRWVVFCFRKRAEKHKIRTISCKSVYAYVHSVVRWLLVYNFLRLNVANKNIFSRQALCVQFGKKRTIASNVAFGCSYHFNRSTNSGGNWNENLFSLFW